MRGHSGYAEALSRDRPPCSEPDRAARSPAVWSQEQPASESLGQCRPDFANGERRSKAPGRAANIRVGRGGHAARRSDVVGVALMVSYALAILN